MNKKIVLIDGHSILNRAFYGVPDLTNSKGIHTNAVYGFLNIMFSVINQEKPDYIAVAFDLKAPTFRHKMYPEYKGTRKPAPEEFKEQVPIIKRVLNSMNILTMEKEGYEADDILGTMAKRAAAEGMDVALISGDRDLLQIADEHIMVRIPKTKGGGSEIENYYPADVYDKYGVNPTEFIALKALMGDSSDNIPGVRGIGEKTASELIATFHSIDGVYEHIDEISKKSIKESLIENKDLAYFCLKLVTIETNADIPYTFEDALIKDFYNEESFKLFTELELKSYLKNFENKFTYESEKFQTVIVNDEKGYSGLLHKINNENYFGFAYDLKESKNENKQFSLFDMDSDSDSKTDLQRICVSFDDFVFVIEKDKYIEDFTDRLSEYIKGDLVKVVINKAKDLYGILKPGTCDDSEAQNITKNLFDVQIAAYLINPLVSDPSVGDIASSYTSVAPFDAKDEEYTKKTAFVLNRAYVKLKDRLVSENMFGLFEEIEMPLSLCLYEMEKEGIGIYPSKLSEFGKELSSNIANLKKDIYEAAGEEFNIDSPKQLAVILFEKLNLEGGKKTKTGYSTAADVLEKLAPDNKIVRDVLEYRTLSKLNSTYVEGLKGQIASDGRIHTTFQQTVTATGRLSSVNPNLQNIPVRTELGRSLRKVFVPKPNCIFMDADYSQIELRILAHMSDDDTLISGFNEGDDVHAITASKVFHVPLEEVTPLLRRRAKAVNFGIVYGISSFGLGQDLDLPKKEAQGYIDEYFKVYPGLKSYLDGCVESAQNKGYSVTMYNRRRPIPEIKASNFIQKSFGERVAMNAPIQGTAADIMKIGMINTRNNLKKAGLEARMLLQVHDELLLEVPVNEKDAAASILKESMEQAAALKVRLDVELNTGDNWYEAK